MHTTSLAARDEAHGKAGAGWPLQMARPGKRRFMAAVAAGAMAVAGLAGMPAQAQTYPDRAVRLIIPFPPGGTLDVVGRMLAQRLGEQTGQSFVVENRPGGNGSIGANAVAKATPDGYTLLFNASTFIMNRTTIFPREKGR